MSSVRLKEIIANGFERVIEVTDEGAGLHAFIAIHNTVLGPALGGTRIFPYANREAALADVLRLAEGMTYKSAVAYAGFGGGKSVIIADSKKDKTPKLLEAFARAVDRLKGIYICAEDIGCTPDDMVTISRITPYVCGLSEGSVHGSGCPSRYTAWGVFRGIQAVCHSIWGTNSAHGRRVAIQGLGNVGLRLAELLFWQGANLIVSDVDPAKVKRAQTQLGAKAVSPSELIGSQCDVLALCAMGGELNDQTIPWLKCAAIAGGANNQLLKSEHGDALAKRDILYAPDFVVNAGGLLNVAGEFDPQGYQPAVIRDKVNNIYDVLLHIFVMAKEQKISTEAAALKLARQNLAGGIGKRREPVNFARKAL